MSVTTLNQPAATSWRKLRHTPLRDLLRGRVTGRLDLDAAVAGHDLPAPLLELAIRTARRTRLWRLERVDVAAELSSHFAEGLECGATASALTASFGDERNAARLIRRAKKRARPAIWHVFRYLRLAVAGCVALYILAGIHFLIGRPDPVTDFGARVNAVAASIPADERAWPLYRAALLEGEPTRELLDDFNRTPRPGEDGWTEIEAYLSRNESMLELYREAASRPGLGFVSRGTIGPEDRALWPDMGGAATDEYSGMLIGHLLPHLSGMRQAARTLAMDMHRAAEQGDGALVLANVDAVIAEAGFVRELPFLINDLVAFAILSHAFETAGEILARRPEAFSDAELVALAHRLSQVDRLMTPRYDGERMSFADILQWTFTDDGEGDGRLTPAGVRMMSMLRSDPSSTVPEDILTGLSLPAINAVMAGRREMLAQYNRLVDAAERESRIPLWERGECVVDREVEAWHDSRWHQMRYLPIVLLMPAMGKASVQGEKIAAERDAVLVAVGLELHRRRTGSWPVSLDELVPGLLPAVPPDRFDGKPLRYRVNDDGPLVYSIGTNRVDDGGTIESVYKASSGSWWLPVSRISRRYVPEGDWVLWPKPMVPLQRFDQ